MKTLYQVSTFKDFTNLGYNGNITIERLLSYGDTGFGTYEALDGEMIVLDGKAYKADGDCGIFEASKYDRTPFATIAFFDPKIHLKIGGIKNCNDLCLNLNKALKNEIDQYCAIGRFDAVFKEIEIHSVWPVKKPYDALASIVDRQKIVMLENLKGTLVGVYCPKWANEKNFVGWHFHFISDNQKWGGHVNTLCTDCIKTSISLKERIEIITEC